MRYLPGRFNYVQKYDTVSLCVGSLFLDYFFVVRLHNVLKLFSFAIAITSQLRYLFVQSVKFF